MFAKSKLAVAILVVAVGLVGCAGIQTQDPNRPFPTQPEIQYDIISDLVSKKPQDFQWYIDENDVGYYNGENALGIAQKAREKGEKAKFTRDFPKLANPSSDTVKNAKLLLEASKKYLKERGFALVDSPCGSCLTAKIDFADLKDGLKVYFFVRTRISYRGREVVVSRDDWFRGVNKGLFNLFTVEGLIAITVEKNYDEMVQAWNFVVTPRGRLQVSEANPSIPATPQQ